MTDKKHILILDDIRSAENVGSIFRTGDAIGIDQIYLLGITPDPIDRFGRSRKDIAKSALGAEVTIPWEHRNNKKELIKELKGSGYKIVSLEQTKDSLDYKKLSVSENIALVVGNEVSGVSKEILELSDIKIEIPMRGGKESLNVSVATGVALFRLFDI